MRRLGPGRFQRAQAASSSLLASICVLAAGCSEGAKPTSPTSRPPQGRPTPSEEDRGEPVSETAARVELLKLFRGADLRMVEDVPVDLGGQSLTVDGLDPGRGVGFEYEDPREAGVQLTPEIRSALESQTDYRILIVPPASIEFLRERAREFLAALPADAR